MTSGETLKKQLNLTKYQHTVISYVIGSSPDTYVVMWDSMRPNMPISKSYLDKYSNIVFYKRGKELRMSVPLSLEKTNMNLNTGIVVTYDIAMSNRTTRESATQDSQRASEKVSVNIEDLIPLSEKRALQKLYVGNLKELTLKDLKDSGKQGISDSTFDWFKDRNKLGFTASKSIKLIDASVSEGDNSFTFYFLAESTEGESEKSKKSGYDYDKPKGEVNPKGFNIKSNPSKTYEIQIKFINLKEFIEYLETKEEGTNVTKKDVEYLISNMDVQYFSNSPSFHWQGYNNISSQLDLSIFPTGITSKQWMPKTFGGEYYLDKHLYSFIQSYRFYSQQMAQMIGKKLRDRKLI